jgi:peroxiredoxin
MLRSQSRGRLALLVALAAALLAGGARADQGPSTDKLNKKVDDFTLTDARGKAVALSGFKDKRAVVVVFLSFECPVSNSYATPLADLARAYEKRGVAFLAVNSSDDGDGAEIAKKAAEYRLPFPVLKDDRHTAADLFKATSVPEAFVLDHNFVLRYRGRIDDGWTARLKRNPRPQRADLKLALDDLLAGKDVSVPATRAVGCAIVRDRVAAAAGKVTYHRDVLPILQRHCQQCHRQGEVGPFSLMTYKQAVNWAADIKEYTQERKMPPWKPVEGPAFHHERRLTEKELATLAAWADGGTPSGDPKDAPPTRSFVDGWYLGKPDLVLTVPEDMTVGAGGKDLFRVFVLPTGLTEDKYVVAVEVRPGNKRVVHHTLNFFDTTGQARKLEEKEKARAKKDDEQDHGPGYSVAMGVGFIPNRNGVFGGLGGWAPGQLGRNLPEGYGYLLPKGSDVLLQVHYHRDGRLEMDRTSIGLYFAKGPQKAYKGLVIQGNFFLVPRNNPAFHVYGGVELDQDCTLHSVMPHMHMLGREVKVTVTPPEGNRFTLVAIKDWDYNWQETYFLKRPIELKKGTRLTVDAVYDNSAKNPNNPFSPPQNVWFGEQTTNEMCFVFLGATSDAPGRIRAHRIDGLPEKKGAVAKPAGAGAE